jgi:Tfp pilus assembly protein PilF
VARTKALGMASATQLHIYGRTLQTQGKQDQAFDIYRMNIKKNPNHWLTHAESARLAVAKGDYDTAVKEMKLAAAGANDQNKPGIEAQVKRLENKEDINR